MCYEQQIDGFTYDDDLSSWRINCDEVDNLPELAFMLNGLPFTLPASAWVMEVIPHSLHRLQMQYTLWHLCAQHRLLSTHADGVSVLSNLLCSIHCCIGPCLSPPGIGCAL